MPTRTDREEDTTAIRIIIKEILDNFCSVISDKIDEQNKRFEKEMGAMEARLNKPIDDLEIRMRVVEEKVTQLKERLGNISIALSIVAVAGNIIAAIVGKTP